jgi:thioredoxin
VRAGGSGRLSIRLDRTRRSTAQRPRDIEHPTGIRKNYEEEQAMSILGGTPGRGTGAGSGAGKDSAVVTVTERDFEREVVRSEIPVLIEFSAEWCGPCKQIEPDVTAFARDMRDKVKVVKVDIDKSPLLARELRVQSVPTFMLFVDQRIADAQVGALGRKQLDRMVEPFLPRAAGALKPVELAQLLRQGHVSAVDTREPAAFGRAHLPGAVNIPFDQIEGRLAELHMLPAQPALYCRSGDKTKELAATLAEQGVPVAFLEGGMLAWEADGLPIERP